MSNESQFAIIGLMNSTDGPVDVWVTINGQQLEIITLGPGEATTQLTPTGAQWEMRGRGEPLPMSMSTAH